MSRIESFLHKLLSRFEHMTIYNCCKSKYLTRWYLVKRERFALYLHLFHASDEDRSLHDHPWRFISFILWRGYYEHTPDRHHFGTPRTIRNRKWPGMILFRPAEWRHRAELVNNKEAVTLIIRFRTRRVWGYHEPTGFIPHDQWWRENCE